MIILTLDLDWAPDYILDYSFKLLFENELKATLFATNDSPAIRNVENLFEIGLHPNITDLRKIDNVIYELKNIFPNARCIRNHRLISSSRFLPVYQKYGLSITSNYAMINQEYIKPIPLLYKIYEYPIYYMDDIHLVKGNHFDARSLIEKLTMKAGLKVIAFHPIHIYLNSNDIRNYESIKGFLGDKKRVDTFVNEDTGIGTIFKALISEHDVKKQTTCFPIESTSFLTTTDNLEKNE